MRRLAVAAFLSSCFLTSQPCWAQEEPQVEVRVEPIKPKQATPVSPDALKWQTQAREVLTIVGDDKMPSIKRGAAYSELMKLKPSPQEDTRLQLAYVLLALNQKRNADAQKLTEQILSVAKNDAPARAHQARLLLLGFRTAPAIVELESLVEALREPAPTASPAQLEHAARFLGLAVGYFNGPGRDLIRPTALAELVVAAQELPKELHNAYEASKLAIEEEFRVLTEEGEEALKALREGLANEAAALREKLEAQKAQAASEAEYKKMELQTNFAQLSNQWQNAWNASQTLSQRGTNLVQRQIQLQATLAAVIPPRRDSEGRVDLNDQQRYLAEVNALQGAINSLDFQIFNLSNQIDRVRAQGMLTERQMGMLQANARQFGMNLAMQNQSFNQFENAIRQKEMAANKAEPKKKSKEQIRREKAFATYDDFNIHKEKKLLLDAIALEQ